MYAAICRPCSSRSASLAITHPPASYGMEGIPEGHSMSSTNTLILAHACAGEPLRLYVRSADAIGLVVAPSPNDPRTLGWSRRDAFVFDPGLFERLRVAYDRGD